jgi:PAS domain S-box-containing protein
VVLAVTGLHRAAFPGLAGKPFILLTFAVALATWVAGIGPGLIATVLAAALGNLLLIEPFGTFKFSGEAGLVTPVFLVVGTGVALLTGSLRWALVRMDAQAESLSAALDERRRAEEAQRETKEKLELALASSELGFWELDLATGEILRDARARPIFGDPRPRVSIEQALERVHPDDRERLGGELRRAMDPGSTGQYELAFRVVHDGGSVRTVESSGKARFHGGRLAHYAGTVRDITERVEAEAELARAKQGLDSLLENSPLAVIEWDLSSLRILRWSQAATRMFGYSAEDALGTGIGAMGWTLEEDEPRVDRLVDDMRAGAGRTVLEKRCRCKGGGLIHTEWYCSTLSVPGSGPRVLSLVLDVTEEKKAVEALHESEKRFRILADGSPVILWVTDAQGANVFVNRTYREYFGVTGEQVEGGHWQPVLHPEDAGGYRASFQRAVREQGPFGGEARVRDRDGQWRWMSSHGEPRFSAQGEFLGHVGISLDVTERRRAEDALRESDRRKNEFLGMLSHELRNPLTSIRASLFLLAKSALDERGKRTSAVIERQVGHLARLIDDLLDATRISSGKIRLQREHLDLAEVVRRTLEDQSDALGRQHLVVHLPEQPVRVFADSARLAQITSNLLANAAKFTPEGGEIGVSVADTGCRAQLSITDTGVGIDPATLERLFVPFSQAERSLDRSRGGLGLGLALVKGLAELHGGTVHASSDGPGRGSCFCVELPLDDRAGAKEGRAPAPRPSGHARKRVLVIEDSRDTAENLREILELERHRVVVARDGREGVEKARSFRPEVVICDIGLPLMDGYAVARSLRGDKATSGMFLVALTGYGQPDDRRRAMEAGFDTHVCKPPDVTALMQLVGAAPPAPAF